jgi:hypothetical protein
MDVGLTGFNLAGHAGSVKRAGIAILAHSMAQREGQDGKTGLTRPNVMVWPVHLNIAHRVVSGCRKTPR